MRAIPLYLLTLILAPPLAAQGEDPSTVDSALQRQLDETQVTFKFLETPLRACVQFLAESSGVKISVSEDVYADEPITFSASAMSLGRALHWLAVLGDADIVLRPGAVLFDSRENVARAMAELRLFDIRDLTLAIVDYPGMSMYPVQAGDEMGAGAVFEADDRLSLDPDTLIELIFSTVESESWDMDGMELATRRGVLFVTNTPQVHDKIAALLADLRAKSIRLVSVEAVVYAVSAGDWLDSVGENASADAPITLNAAQARALRAEPGKLELRTQLQTNCASGQRVSVHVGGQSTHLLDIDVEVAQGSAIGDPIMVVQPTGIMLDVRPTPSADGKTVVLRVRLESSELVDLQEVPYGAGDRNASLTRPRLELPRMATFEAHTSVRIERGGASVFTFDDPSSVAMPGDRLVLLLQAQLAEGEDDR